MEKRKDTREEVLEENNENKELDKEVIIQIKKGVAEYSSNTLSMEKEREERIYKTAGIIITCISILLVAVMSLIFELLDRLKQVDYLIVIFGCILAVILLCSLLFAIIAHWFYKRQYTRSGIELLDYINNHIDEYKSEERFIDQKILDNDNIYKSLESCNNKRLKSLITSLIFIYVFLALIVVFGIVILIVAV